MKLNIPQLSIIMSCFQVSFLKYFLKGKNKSKCDIVIQRKSLSNATFDSRWLLGLISMEIS